MAKREPPPPEAPGTHGLQELATLLEITPQWFLRLVAKKFIPREDRGKYNLVAAVRGYIRYLKDEERRASKSAAASKVQDARARQIEQRTARDARSLIDFDEAEGVCEAIVGAYNSRLAGLPAACTRDVAQQRVIEAHVEGIQRDVAKLLAEWAKDVRAGRRAGDAGDPDDG